MYLNTALIKLKLRVQSKHLKTFRPQPKKKGTTHKQPPPIIAIERLLEMSEKGVNT